jgi:hypothetical protein
VGLLVLLVVPGLLVLRERREILVKSKAVSFAKHPDLSQNCFSNKNALKATMRLPDSSCN